MSEDFQRIVEVDEGVDPIAGHALDRELLVDQRDEVGVGPHLVAERREALCQVSALAGEALVFVSDRRVPDRSVSQYEPDRVHRVVGVELDACDHAARVVGDDPADTGRADRRRIGADPAPVWAQHPVHHLSGRPWLGAHPSTVVEDLDRGEAVAAVGDYPLADRLAREARAAGAKSDRQAHLAGDTEQSDHLLLICYANDGLGPVLVEATVASVDGERDRGRVDPALGQHVAQTSTDGIGRHLVLPWL